MYSVLNQLDIEYIDEYTPKWAGKFRYDVYIPSINCIIENHGKQHYEERLSWLGKTIEEIQEIDEYKKETAILNGIQHYIVIDCRESSVQWIKDNIIKSELPSLLKFNESDIDWVECGEFATRNFIKDIADLWNNGMSVGEISKKINKTVNMASIHLYRAAESGWCDYSREASLKRQYDNMKNGKSPVAKSVRCIETRVVYCSQTEASRQTGISISSIGECCRGKQKTAGGYRWEFVERR